MGRKNRGEETRRGSRAREEPDKRRREGKRARKGRRLREGSKMKGHKEQLIEEEKKRLKVERNFNGKKRKRGVGGDRG